LLDKAERRLVATLSGWPDRSGDASQSDDPPATPEERAVSFHVGRAAPRTKRVSP
jgi:hypothetical protein